MADVTVLDLELELIKKLFYLKYDTIIGQQKLSTTAGYVSRSSRDGRRGPCHVADRKGPS